MKTVANLGSLQEAQTLKLRLASVGIEAFIPDEISAGVAPHLFMTDAGVRVQVDDGDEDQARQMIERGPDQGDPPEADARD